MSKFNFRAKPIGITCTYDKGDSRLTDTVDIHCAYAGKGIMKNRVCHKTVTVTEAEKAVIESIAMRLFLDHKKVIQTTKDADGKVHLTGVIAVDAVK